MVPKIAISYRRSDSQDITGRIFDRLQQHFGKDSIFRDIDNIRPGIDFRVQISEALRTTDVLLVVVGPKWFGRAKGADSRIDNKADPVRIEVETALQRDIPVIPVLVGSAKMPTTAQLPDGLKDFAYRHAVTVDGGRDFDHHLEGLIRALDGILDSKVDVANSKAASDERPIRPRQSVGVLSTSTADAIPAGSPAKLQPPEHSPNGSFGNVADHVGPSSATLQTETLNSKKSDSAGLARLIWPEGPIGRVLRVGLVVFVVGLAAVAMLRVQVAENARRAAETQLEDARKAADAKAAEDARKAAEAKAADAKAAEDARKAADAKAAEDARKAAAAKAAEDARKTAEDERKAAAAKAAEDARKAAAQQSSAARGQGVQENFPSPTSVESLSETKWSGKAGSDSFEVEFHSDHSFKYARNSRSYSNAIWSQNGNAVHMEFNNKYSEYDGKIEGNQIKGTAKNIKGFSWEWSLTKRDATEDARKAVDAKPDLDTLRKAAEAGDVDAMVSLANRYFDHKGDTYNFAEAMRWWKRAANSGNSSAMRVVGFQSGDPQEALRWYRKAAEAGDPQAMMDLPRISEKANVAMDVLEQARWRLEACKKGPWFRYDLRIDSRSLEVGVRKAMQDLLRSAGVYRGPSTGEFDEATLRALEDYYAKAPDMPPGAATDVNSTQSHGN